MTYNSSRTTSNNTEENLDKHLKLDDKLDSHQKPVKIGDDITGLLLGGKDVKVEGSLTIDGQIDGKYLAVSGDDITLDAKTTVTVSDFGAATAFKIDADQPATPLAEDSTGLFIDYDRAVATSGTAAHNDIGIDLDVNSASLGTSYVKGMDIDVVGATSGNHTATGIDLTVSGADRNEGLNITAPSHSAYDYHIRLFAADDVNDYATISLADTGNLTIATTGDGGDIKLEAASGGVKVAEASAAAADTAGYGQIWVDDATPNELAFTDDAGTDIVGIGKYHYETKVCNFSASSGTTFYLPLAGYVIEGTSSAGRNEYQTMIAPFNGTIEKFAWRSEAAQGTGAGTMRLMIAESNDGTEVPGLNVFRKDLSSLSIADDTYTEYDLTSPSVGTFPIPLVKGRIYSVQCTFAATPYDTNCILVFKWDITS